MRDSRSRSKSRGAILSTRGGLLQRQKSKSVPDLRKVVSRKDVLAVTMNMSGRSGLGLTPRYKIDMVKEFLTVLVPDIIVVQDAIDLSDMGGVLDAVGHGSYQWYFRPDHSQTGVQEDDHEEEADADNPKRVTGIVWNKEKYIGTPLQLDDERLSEFSKWLKKHNIVIVKLDSCQRINGGAEDVYPSFVAIAWHGPDYEIALRHRNQICEELFSFLSLLRRKNWFVPILIGGDFNIDLKSFDFDRHADFLFVPYRPISGNLAKDLKNTFLFTVDSLQVTETSFKQFHPDIFPSPFITVRLRGRTKIKIWAVVKIQRWVRSYFKRKHQARLGVKKLKDSKKRWRRKIEGEAYVSEPESQEEEEEEEAIQMPAVTNNGNGVSRPTTRMSMDELSVERKSSSLKESEAISVPLVNHRRKRYSDLKSIYEKRDEMRSNEPLMRNYQKSERFDF